MCVNLEAHLTSLLGDLLGFSALQSGLAGIKERLMQETVERYGVSKEFMKAEADTMREVLTEINRR